MCPVSQLAVSTQAPLIKVTFFNVSCGLRNVMVLNLETLTKARLPQLHTPMSNSSKAEHVFPVCTHTQTCMLHTHRYIHTHRASCTDSNADTLSTHMNTTSTYSLTLNPSLADQGEGPLVGNMYIYTMWTPPAAGLRHSVCPVAAHGSWPPQMLAPGYTSP